MVSHSQLCRILDANINRAKEGLRVCEDICRFIYNEQKLTRRYKKVRHQLTTIILKFPGALIQSRAVEKDVGRASTRTERRRKNVDDILYANSQRVKESLRVLEEFAKIDTPKLSESLKKLRYQIYRLEQDAALRR